MRNDSDQWADFEKASTSFPLIIDLNYTLLGLIFYWPKVRLPHLGSSETPEKNILNNRQGTEP